jgi:hypothetical protein
MKKVTIKKMKIFSIKFKTLLSILIIIVIAFTSLYLYTKAVDDIDGDTIVDSIDNCKRVPNPFQEDLDPSEVVAFDDGFESGISSDWDTPTFWDPSSGVSSSQTYSGASSLYLSGYDSVVKTFSSGKTGNLSIWFFDGNDNNVNPGAGYDGAFIEDINPSVVSFMIGDLAAIGASEDYYSYTLDGRVHLYEHFSIPGVRMAPDTLWHFLQQWYGFIF